MRANPPERMHVLRTVICGLILLLSAAPMVEAGKPQCNDGSDNDGDGLTDYGSDPDCESKNDGTEAPAAPPPSDKTECNDGLDNDRDGRIDLADESCESKTDTHEGTEYMTCDSRPDVMGPCPPHQCNNGADDDGDGRVDGQDPGCWAGRNERATTGHYPYHCDEYNNPGLSQVWYTLCLVQWRADETYYYALDQV